MDYQLTCDAEAYIWFLKELQAQTIIQDGQPLFRGVLDP